MSEICPSKISAKTPNCLNTIRLLAAVQVFVGHASAHLNVKIPRFISFFLSYFPGVPIFFLLSGYLIWQSVERYPSYSVYLKKRFWRIYPELWLVVGMEVISICVFYAPSISLSDWLKFIFTQATFMQFWTPDSMRGYGCGVPNGSLWTICIFVQFYLVIWLIHKVMHEKHKWIWPVVFISSFVFAFAIKGLQRFLPEIPYKLLCNTIPFYLWMFLLGAFVAEYRTQIIPILKKYWFLFFVGRTLYMVLPFEVPSPNYDLVYTICSFLGCLGFSYRYPRFNIKRDISYEIYLYHMIFINVMIELGYTARYSYFLIALILSCAAAFLSNIIVENIRHFVNKRRKEYEL